MKKYFFIPVLVILLIISCKGRGYYSSSKMAESYANEPLREESINMKGEDSYNDSVENKKQTSQNLNKEIGETKVEKKIIKRASLAIEIKNIKNNELELNRIVNQFQGYIAVSNVYETSSYYEIKIPAEKFDEFLENISKLGRVTSKNITSEDVTLKYYDLESRINTKKILQERYTKYLKEAKTTKDLLEIEQALNNVTAEIESFETQMKNLKHLISYSTITVSFSIPMITPTNVVHFDFPSIRNGFVSFINFFVAFIYYVFFIVLFAIPFILLIGLLYYLTFGKLGLVKKFFKKLKG